METPDGNYFTYQEQRPRAEAGETVQPRTTVALGEITIGGEVLEPRGVVFVRGTYKDYPDFTPLIEEAGILGAVDPASRARTPETATNTWHPPLPVSLQPPILADGANTVLVGRRQAALLLYPGQYNERLQTERLFTRIELDEYYASGTDRERPTMAAIQIETDASSSRLQVTATDASGIERIAVAYVESPGEWTSADLTRGESSDQWQGTFTSDAASFLIIQAVDGAGNVAISTYADRDDGEQIYLPTVRR